MKGYVSKLKAILIIFKEKRTSYPLYFQQVYLPCNSLDDFDILRKHFTFLKLKPFEVWEKSNDGLESTNYFS